MSVKVGDRVMLRQLSDGRTVATKSGTPKVGDIVTLDSNGTLSVHKSGTPKVGEKIILVQNNDGRKVAIKSGGVDTGVGWLVFFQSVSIDQLGWKLSRDNFYSELKLIKPGAGYVINDFSGYNILTNGNNNDKLLNHRLLHYVGDGELFLFGWGGEITPIVMYGMDLIECINYFRSGESFVTGDGNLYLTDYSLPYTVILEEGVTWPGDDYFIDSLEHVSSDSKILEIEDPDDLETKIKVIQSTHEFIMRCYVQVDYGDLPRIDICYIQSMEGGFDQRVYRGPTESSVTNINNLYYTIKKKSIYRSLKNPAKIIKNNKSEFIFDSETERDEYFTTNPDNLKTGIFVTVNSGDQRYTGEEWENIGEIIVSKIDSDDKLEITYSSNKDTIHYDDEGSSYHYKDTVTTNCNFILKTYDNIITISLSSVLIDLLDYVGYFAGNHDWIALQNFKYNYTFEFNGTQLINGSGEYDWSYLVDINNQNTIYKVVNTVNPFQCMLRFSLLRDLFQGVQGYSYCVWNYYYFDSIPEHYALTPYSYTNADKDILPLMISCIPKKEGSYDKEAIFHEGLSSGLDIDGNTYLSGINTGRPVDYDSSGNLWYDHFRERYFNTYPINGIHLGECEFTVSYTFENTEDRDAYFTTNPDKLKDGVFIKLGTRYQLYLVVDKYTFTGINPLTLSTESSWIDIANIYSNGLYCYLKPGFIFDKTTWSDKSSLIISSISSSTFGILGGIDVGTAFYYPILPQMIVPIIEYTAEGCEMAGTEYDY